MPWPRHLLERTTFNWRWLTVSEVSPFSSWHVTWLPAGRHSPGGAKSSTSWSAGSRKEIEFHIGQSLYIGDLKAHPYSDTLPPRPHILIVPLCGPSIQTHGSLGTIPIKTITWGDPVGGGAMADNILQEAWISWPRREFREGPDLLS